MSAASAKPAVKEVTEVVDASPLVVPERDGRVAPQRARGGGIVCNGGRGPRDDRARDDDEAPSRIRDVAAPPPPGPATPYIIGRELASSSQLRGTAARRAQVVGVGRFYLRVEVTTTRGGGRRRDCGRCSNRDSIPPPPPLLSVARVRFMSSKGDVFCAGHERESEISGGCFEPGTRQRKRER